MKIVHVIHWPRTGITRLVKNLISSNAGDDSFYVVMIDGDVEEFESLSNVCVAAYSLNDAKRLLNKYIMFKQLINDIKPDIIHTHSFTPSVISALARLPKSKYVRTFHSIYPYFYEKSIKSKIKRVIECFVLDMTLSSIICVDESVLSELPCKTFNKVPMVIENGIDLRSFEFGEIKNRKDNNDPIKLVAMGRLELQKGFDLAIPAIRRVIDQGYSVTLDIYGLGSQREHLDHLINKWELKEYVNLQGYTSCPMNVYKKYDWLISPSRYEGFGLSIAEAIAIGLPVIAFPSGGIPNKLEDKVNGIILKELSVKALAEGIIDLIKMPFERYEDIVEEGRKFVKARYNISETSINYIKLYDEIIG